MQCAFIKKNIAKKKESIDVKKKLIMGYLKKKIKNNFIIKPVFLLKVMKDERQLQLLHQYLWWYHHKVGCFILLTAFIFMSMNISDF